MRRHGAKQGIGWITAWPVTRLHDIPACVRCAASRPRHLAWRFPRGLSAQSVAFGNDDPTNPAATDVTMIAFQQSWKTIGDECTKPMVRKA